MDCCLLLSLLIFGAGDTPGVSGPHGGYYSYARAMGAAKASNEMMVVYFYNGQMQDDYVYKLLTTDKDLVVASKSCTMAYVPTNYSASVGGREMRLLDHPAFSELRRGPGFVFIDFGDPKSKHYGHVVTVYPLSVGSIYYMSNPVNKNYILQLFKLPRASLSQRTMIWAVRVHPERPQSTYGQFSSYLADEAESHSNYQAAITNQGHHNWDSRFHRINGHFPGYLAQEVCAESWPGKGLFAAAIDCVHSWRQSSGHWSAVRSRQNYYGYDISRGRNGIWYATGIFSARR